MSAHTVVSFVGRRLLRNDRKKVANLAGHPIAVAPVRRRGSEDPQVSHRHRVKPHLPVLGNGDSEGAARHLAADLRLLPTEDALHLPNHPHIPANAVMRVDRHHPGNVAMSVDLPFLINAATRVALPHPESVEMPADPHLHECAASPVVPLLHESAEMAVDPLLPVSAEMPVDPLHPKAEARACHQSRNEPPAPHPSVGPPPAEKEANLVSDMSGARKTYLFISQNNIFQNPDGK